MDQSVGAAHSGGSCQISFSYDKGQTWVVVQSWQGNCPRVSVPGTIDNHYDLNQNYTFNIPSSFPSGDRVIVAWSWINASGNREFYMSCSCISIQGDSTATATTPNGPPLLIANLPAQPPSNPSTPPTNDSIWEQCHTLDDTSIIYPLSYQGINPAVFAPVALNLQSFLGGKNTTCGSDNLEMVSILGRFASGPISSTFPSPVDSSTPALVSSSEVQKLERRQTSDGSSTTIITAEITGSWMYFSLPYIPASNSTAADPATTDPAATASMATDPTTTDLTAADTATVDSVTTDPDPATSVVTSDSTDATSVTTGPNLTTPTSSTSYQLAWTGVSNGSYLLAASSNSSNWTFSGGPSATTSNSASVGISQSSSASSLSIVSATVVTLLAVTTALLVSPSMQDNC